MVALPATHPASPTADTKHFFRLLDLPPELLREALSNAPLGARGTCCTLRAVLDAERRTLSLCPRAGGTRQAARQLTALLHRLPQLQALDYSQVIGGYSHTSGGGAATAGAAADTYAFLAACPTSLTSLTASPYHLKGGVDALSAFTALRTLSLAKCGHVTSIAALVPLTGLTALNLSSCPALSTLEPLAACVRIEHLDISRCPGVLDLSPLALLPALSSLDLSHCATLPNLSALAHCPRLTALTFAGAHLERHVPMISACAPHLQVLDLSDARATAGAGAVDLAPLAVLVSLRFLNLGGPANARSMNSLNGVALVARIAPLLPAHSPSPLTVLDLSGRVGITDLAALTAFTRLRTLGLGGGDRGTDIGGALIDLSDLAPLPTGLTSLDLSGLPALRDVAPLAACPNLRSLCLDNCAHVACLAPLVPSCESLTDLSLRGCKALQEVWPLAAFSALRRLDLHGTGVALLGPLAHCGALQWLDVQGSAVPGDGGGGGRGGGGGGGILALLACTRLTTLRVCDRTAGPYNVRQLVREGGGRLAVEQQWTSPPLGAEALSVEGALKDGRGSDESLQ